MTAGSDLRSCFRVSPWGTTREGQKDSRQLQREGEKSAEAPRQAWCGSVEKMRHIFQVARLICLKGFECLVPLVTSRWRFEFWTLTSQARTMLGFCPPKQAWCTYYIKACRPSRQPAAMGFCCSLSWRHRFLILHSAFLQMAMRSFPGHLAYTAYRAA